MNTKILVSFFGFDTSSAGGVILNIGAIGWAHGGHDLREGHGVHDLRGWVADPP